MQNRRCTVGAKFDGAFFKKRAQYKNCVKPFVDAVSLLITRSSVKPWPSIHRRDANHGVRVIPIIAYEVYLAVSFLLK